MIDNFVLALSHGLILVAAWRLTRRDDLDCDQGGTEPPRSARFPIRPRARGDA